MPQRDLWLEALDPVEVFKSDRRSHVWLARHPDLGKVVVKRFEYAPWRQRLGAWIALHPAQRERRMNRRLASTGVAVVPIIRHGTQRSWHGIRVWLMTPLWGKSLQRRLTQGGGVAWPVRRRIVTGIIDIIDRLLRRGLVFRDLKTSNIVADGEGQVWLIDVGGVRRRSESRILAMLAMLDQTAARDGATRSDRLRVLRRIAKLHPDLGHWRDLAAAVRQRHGRR